MNDIDENDIIQIVPSHKWGGCFAVVSEVKTWGCQCYVPVPHNDGTKVSLAFIRLVWGEFEKLNAKPIFIVSGE